MNDKEEKIRDSWVNGEIKGVELKSFAFNTNDSEQDLKTLNRLKYGL